MTVILEVPTTVGLAMTAMGVAYLLTVAALAWKTIKIRELEARIRQLETELTQVRSSMS